MKPYRDVVTRQRSVLPYQQIENDPLEIFPALASAVILGHAYLNTRRRRKEADQYWDVFDQERSFLEGIAVELDDDFLFLDLPLGKREVRFRIDPETKPSQLAILLKKDIAQHWRLNPAVAILRTRTYLEPIVQDLAFKYCPYPQRTLHRIIELERRKRPRYLQLASQSS